MNGDHVIVWDLDGTLGHFDALAGNGLCTTPIQVQVRPHLQETLARLSAVGFRHTLLTLSTQMYAEIVLRALDIRKHFALVEGLGQRGKGDAAGIGAELGIPHRELHHRMIFVGDHPFNDEPRDSRVLFHIEPFALTRSAKCYADLVLSLRDLGQGSLRDGFDVAGRGPWWRFWRRGLAANRPVRSVVPGVPPLMLMRRKTDCPVIGFAEPPESGKADEISFVPADMVALVGEMQVN